MATDCKCLQQYARDPKVPYRYDESTKSYTLYLTKDVSIPNARCIFCGGYGFPDLHGRYRLRARCHCGALRRWANDPTVPVEYDEELNEYSLVPDWGAGDQNKMQIYFCPACGGRAPLSHRGDLFTTPSRREMKAISRKVAGVKSLDQLRGVLGEPDKRSGPHIQNADQQEIYGVKDVREQLVYRSLGRTVELCVQEYVDGKVGLLFSGKRRRRTAADRLRRWARRAWDLLR